MSDDEEGRLLIDDHDMSGGPLNSSLTEGIFASVADDCKTGAKANVFLNDSLMKSDNSNAVLVPNLDSTQLHQLPGGAPSNGIRGQTIITTIDSGRQPEVPLSKMDDSREEGEIDDEVDGSAPQTVAHTVPPPLMSLSTTWPQFPYAAASPGGPRPASATPVDSSALLVDTNVKLEKSGPSSSSGLSGLRAPVQPKKSPVPTKISPGRMKKNIFDDTSFENGTAHAAPRPKMGATAHSAFPDADRKLKEEGRDDRKRLSTAPRVPEFATVKKHKTVKEKGTSVQSVAVQCDSDDHLFDQEPGTTGILQYTVVCKTDNNAVYISVRFKDEEYYGVLTDGQPSFPANMGKKRPNINGGNQSVRDSDSRDGDRSNSGTSTPSKLNRNNGAPGTPREQKRGNRGSSVPAEKKRSIAGIRTDEKEEEDGEQSDITRGGQVVLYEVPNRICQHICGHNGCEHRYDKASELEYHKMNAHSARKIMYDSHCSQTERIVHDRGTDIVDLMNVEHTASQTDVTGELPAQHRASAISDMAESEQQRSIHLLMSKGRRDTVETLPATSGDGRQSGFSDISDENDAPQLQKEQPSPVIRENTTSAPSAFTPTNASSRNEESVSTLQGGIDRKEASSALPIASATPAAQSTAFHPVESSAGRCRPSSVASTPHVMTASPRSVVAQPTPTPQGAYLMGIPPGYAMYMNPAAMAQMGGGPLAGPSSSPARPQDVSSSQQHKIHELKMRAGAGSASAASSDASPATNSASTSVLAPSPVVASPAAPKLSTSSQQSAAPSPARPQPTPAAPSQMAAFMQMVPGQQGANQVNQHQLNAQQQMQMQLVQQQALQQQQMMMMALTGRLPQPGFPGQMNPDMAQMAALQHAAQAAAAQMYGPGGLQMFSNPK